ncbi:MAG TPA: hypothetical protein PLM90_09400 [Chitinophagales bacterium]|nr:hypothetical protein [Chitinophagales bacterium]
MIELKVHLFMNGGMSEELKAIIDTGAYYNYVCKRTVIGNSPVNYIGDRTYFNINNVELTDKAYSAAIGIVGHKDPFKFEFMIKEDSFIDVILGTKFLSDFKIISILDGGVGKFKLYSSHFGDMISSLNI